MPKTIAIARRGADPQTTTASLVVMQYFGAMTPTAYGYDYEYFDCKVKIKSGTLGEMLDDRHDLSVLLKKNSYVLFDRWSRGGAFYYMPPPETLNAYEPICYEIQIVFN